jgi:Mn-dependent DtxR family transcriptional regulator
MGIDIDEFENGDPDEWREPTNAERVVAFLARREDRAWSRSEIADRAGVKRNSIGAVLSRLEDDGLVRHRGGYWAITDDEERLRGAVEFHELAERLDVAFGPERRSDWTAEENG